MNRLVDVFYRSLNTVDQIANPLLRRLYEDWRSAAPPASLPDHSMVDPMKLSYLLGYLVIVGVVRDDRGDIRFQYRLIGTKLVDRWSRDFTGRWMDEHDDPEVARSGPPSCRLAVDTRGPVHIDAKRLLDGHFYPVEYLVLPLIGDDLKTIDRLLIAQVYPPETPHVPYGSASTNR